MKRNDVSLFCGLHFTSRDKVKVGLYANRVDEINGPFRDDILVASLSFRRARDTDLRPKLDLAAFRHRRASGNRRIPDRTAQAKRAFHIEVGEIVRNADEAGSRDCDVEFDGIDHALLRRTGDSGLRRTGGDSRKDLLSQVDISPINAA